MNFLTLPASTAVGESMAKLASGMHINKSSDDAAGLAISEKNRANSELVDEMDRITASTEFNGIKLLRGDEMEKGEDFTIHVGAGMLKVSIHLADSPTKSLPNFLQSTNHRVCRFISQLTDVIQQTSKIPFAIVTSSKRWKQRFSKNIHPTKQKFF